MFDKPTGMGIYLDFGVTFSLFGLSNVYIIKYMIKPAKIISARTGKRLRKEET